MNTNIRSPAALYPLDGKPLLKYYTAHKMWACIGNDGTCGYGPTQGKAYADWQLECCMKDQPMVFEVCPESAYYEELNRGYFADRL
jgi:hypothetical protein